MHDTPKTAMNTPRRSQSHRSSHEKEPAGMIIDYQHMWRLCLKYWKWLLAVSVLGAVIGLLVALSETTIYAARASIVVAATASHESGDVIGSNMMALSAGDSTMKTVEQLLQTRSLMERVVRDEKLNENPDFLPSGVTAPTSEEFAQTFLLTHTEIRTRLGTRLIDITVEHHSPQMAKFLADKLARASVVQATDQTTSGVSELADSLQKHVDDLAAKSAEATANLIQYEQEHHLDGTIDPSDLATAEVKDLHQRYDEALANLALLSERYGQSHPKLIEAQKEVDELHARLLKSENNALSSDASGIEYTQLKGTADALTAELTTMRKALQDARTQEHVTDPGISVAELAEMPLAPVRPSKTKDVAGGAAAGVFLGLCFILGLYFLDTSIRTVAQAEALLGVPVIAAIPILAEAASRSKLPTFSDPQSFVAEAFRGLRASLLLHDRENPLRVILVGSAIPGEGKSFCACNLAVAFAQAGLRTLLIDGDLRLPTAFEYFGQTQDEETKGFPAVLGGRAKLDNAVIKSQVTNLDLLLTTSPAESPAELLSGTHVLPIIDEAARKYDRVVLDSAPLNAVSDTMLMLQKTDAILLVVRAGSTPGSESKAALQKIYDSKMKPLGLILNYLAAHTLKSYAYGYSYGSKPPKGKYAK
jgi:capsular exopolysaccharide synthesis family protein